MARKKKNSLPSGNIRIQVYDYTDVDGKKHYKSFTAPTRQEAKLMAAEWKAGKADKKPSRITLYEAVSRYIEAEEGVFIAKHHKKLYSHAGEPHEGYWKDMAGRINQYGCADMGE